MNKGFKRAVLTMCFAATSCVPLRAELVGHWKFDTAEGEVTPDAGSGEHHGVLADGSVIVDDAERGSVLRVAGPGKGGGVDFPTLADGYVLPENAGATIAVWVKRDGDGTGGDVYDSLFTLAGRHAELLSISLDSENKTRKGPSGIVVYFEGDKPGNNKDGDQVTLGMQGVVPDDTWSHVAVTLNRKDNVGYLYFNGIPMGPFDLSGVGDGPLIWAKASVNAFGGCLDELMFFDAPLTHEEIAILAKSQP